LTIPLLPSLPRRRHLNRTRRNRAVRAYKAHVVVAPQPQRPLLDRTLPDTLPLTRITRQTTREAVTSHHRPTRHRVGQRRISIPIHLALSSRRHLNRTRRNREVRADKAQVVVAPQRQRPLLDRIRAAKHRLTRITR